MSWQFDRAEIAPAAPELPRPMLVKTLQQAKRLVKIVVGFTVLLAGIVMLVTPGPGLVTIAGGLAILAAEFAWARWMLNKLKERGVQLRDAVFPNSKPKQDEKPS